jgi:hypothetical protein
LIFGKRIFFYFFPLLKPKFWSASLSAQKHKFPSPPPYNNCLLPLTVISHPFFVIAISSHAPNANNGIRPYKIYTFKLQLPGTNLQITAFTITAIVLQACNQIINAITIDYFTFAYNSLFEWPLLVSFLLETLKRLGDWVT